MPRSSSRRRPPLLQDVGRLAQPAGVYRRDKVAAQLQPARALDVLLNQFTVGPAEQRRVVAQPSGDPVVWLAAQLEVPLALPVCCPATRILHHLGALALVRARIHGVALQGVPGLEQHIVRQLHHGFATGTLADVQETHRAACKLLDQGVADARAQQVAFLGRLAHPPAAMHRGQAAEQGVQLRRRDVARGGLGHLRHRALEPAQPLVGRSRYGAAAGVV